MGFIKYLLINSKERKFMAVISVIFFLFYCAMNMKIIKLMKADIINGPFVQVPFRINVFNFDPILHYGTAGSNITHPFLRFISIPIGKLSGIFVDENLGMLIIQSLIVGLTTALLYSYCRNMELNRKLSLAITAIFGFSSYSIIISLVPDSYPYAQFFIVLSVCYLQYINQKSDNAKISGLVTLGIINFGITLTNVVPFVLSAFVSKLDEKLLGYVKKLLFTLLISVFSIVCLSLIDRYLLPGTSWTINIWGGIETGGYNYVSNFQWSEHAHVLYSLFIAPLLFPRFQVMDVTGLVAIVTKNQSPFPMIIEFTGYVIILLSLLGIILNLGKRNVWILIVYIGFSFWLHLIKGFGLATHEYDLFLYAGHYIFAFILSVAWLGIKIQSSKRLFVIFLSILILIVIVQLGNNFIRMTNLEEYIRQVYIFSLPIN